MGVDSMSTRSAIPWLLGHNYGTADLAPLLLAPNTVVAWSRRNGTSYPVTPEVYGTLKCGNVRQDRLNSKYIIMWGWNPAEARGRHGHDERRDLGHPDRGAHPLPKLGGPP